MVITQRSVESVYKQFMLPEPSTLSLPILTLGACSWTTLFKVDAWPSGSAKIMPSAALQLGDGMSASAACAIAALEGNVVWLGRVGHDDNGKAAVRSLQAAGVDCSGIHWVDGVAGSFCTVLIDAQGERLVVPRHDPALPSAADWLPLANVHEYALVLTEVRWHEGAIAILQAARRAGKPGVLDAEASGPGQLQQLCNEASHILFSETGLAHWLNESASYFSQCLPDPRALNTSISKALKKVLAQTTCELAGVTLGGEGFYWLQRADVSDAGVQHQPALKLKAVDTLAAGDVFHGAYAWAMTRSTNPHQWARVATVAASLKCQTFGGRLGTPNLLALRQALGEC